MTRLTDDIRHERERGLIIEVLIEAKLKFIPLYLLVSMMEGQDWPLGEGDPAKALEDLNFQLTYLADLGLVERRNPREGKLKLDIQLVRATGKAVDVKDGRIERPTGIRF